MSRSDKAKHGDIVMTPLYGAGVAAVFALKAEGRSRACPGDLEFYSTEQE